MYVSLSLRGSGLNVCMYVCMYVRHDCGCAHAYGDVVRVAVPTDRLQWVAAGDSLYGRQRPRFDGLR